MKARATRPGLGRPLQLRSRTCWGSSCSVEADVKCLQGAWIPAPSCLVHCPSRYHQPPARPAGVDEWVPPLCWTNFP